MAERRVDPEQASFGENLLGLATALGFELDRPVIRVYWHALRDVPAEFRDRSLLVAGERQWFKFPRPADLVRIAGELIAERRKEVLTAAMSGECVQCGNIRWIEIRDPENVKRMMRCECWVNAHKAMDRVGRVLALPPSREQLAEEAAERRLLGDGGD